MLCFNALPISAKKHNSILKQVAILTLLKLLMGVAEINMNCSQVPLNSTKTFCYASSVSGLRCDLKENYSASSLLFNNYIKVFNKLKQLMNILQGQTYYKNFKVFYILTYMVTIN